MQKRRFLGGLLLAPLVPHWAEAQTSSKTFKVGLLSNFPAPIMGGRLWEAFIQALKQEGYVEGKNVSFELRNAEGATEKLPALAAELVRLGVDVLVVGGSAAGPGGSRRERGDAHDSDRHGRRHRSGRLGVRREPGQARRQHHGIADFHAELDPKRLELLKALVPGAVKVTLTTAHFGRPEPIPHHAVGQGDGEGVRGPADSPDHAVHGYAGRLRQGQGGHRGRSAPCVVRVSPRRCR
jgi:putative ABC transport system substrate-binding protein